MTSTVGPAPKAAFLHIPQMTTHSSHCNYVPSMYWRRRTATGYSCQIFVNAHCSTAQRLFIPLRTHRHGTQLRCASERAKMHHVDQKSFSLCSWNQTGLGRHFICAHFLNGYRIVAIIISLHILHISPFIPGLASQLCS